jgi:hypothetical protein
MEDIDALIDKLAQEGAAVKIAPHPYSLCLKWLGWALAYLGLALALSGLRPDVMAKFQQPLFAVEIVMLFGLLIAASLSAALLAYPDLYGKRGTAFAPAILFALFFLLIFFAWQADSPPAPLPAHSFECTISITLVALLPALWTFYALRRYASTHSRAAGAVALLMAFSVGALWLRLHEVNDSIIHLIQWHYLPMIAFSAAGMWLGKRVLKW